MKRCAICQVHCQQALCSGCQSLIQALENPCQICAKPLNQTDSICGECRSDPPAFSQTICASIYEPPVSVWVQQLKFSNRLDRARIMAEAMLNLLSQVTVDVPIIPIPLHVKRLRLRGYNQAYEVAKIICHTQGRPLLSDVLVRNKFTAMQAELREKQRADNVRAAFKVVKPIKASTVILLDDVMTTGQTLRSAAKTLRKAGIKHIQVAVFARSAG